MPTSDDMMQIYLQLKDELATLEVNPTYFSANDGTGRGKLKAWNGEFHKKALGKRLAGYRMFTLIANPPGSEKPGYDAFATAFFSFSPAAETVSVSIVVNEPYMIVGSATYNSVIENLARLWLWDYGFGFERDSASLPDVFLAGGSTNGGNAEDDRRSAIWYASPHDFFKGVEPPRRLVMVRDVFPYNIVGPAHLAHRLSDGRSLRAFIETDPYSSLQPLANNLWLWSVTPNRTEVVRDKLRGMGIVISE